MGTRNVKFTGDRTGLAEIAVPRHGVLKVGDVIALSEERAAAYTTEHPTGEPGTLEDFLDRWTKDQMVVIARDHGIDEGGNKDELAKRILKARPQEAPALSKADFVYTDEVPFQPEDETPPAPEPANDTDTADDGEGVI